MERDEPFAYEFTIKSPDGSIVTVGRSTALEGLEALLAQDATGALKILTNTTTGMLEPAVAEEPLPDTVPTIDAYIEAFSGATERAIAQVSEPVLIEALVRHGIARTDKSAHVQLAKYRKPESYEPQIGPKAPAMLKRATAVALVMSAAGISRETERARTVEGFLDANAEITYGITKLTQAETFSDLLDRSFYRPGVGFDRDALSTCSLDVVDPNQSETVARRLNALTPHSREWHDTLAIYVEKQATAHRNLNGAVGVLIDHDPKDPLEPKLMAKAVERACLGPHDPVIEHLRTAYGGIAFVKHG